MASQLAEVLPLEEFGMQVCRKCDQALPLAEFYKLHTMRLGHRTVCKQCSSEYAREWNVKNADKYFDGHLRRTFGITLDDYNAMLEQQGGVCAICGGGPTARSNRRRGNGKVFQPRLVVDHDHATGKVRGLLCSTCNTGIGGLKDDPALVRRALEYLEEERHDTPGDAPRRKASRKLSEADIEWIRSGCGGLSQTEAAKKLGVTQSVVSRVFTGARGR